MGKDNGSNGSAGVPSQYTVFSCQNYNFAMEINHVQEILSNPTLTRVPNVKSFMQGVFNLRGRIYSVVHLSRLFNITDKFVVENPMVILAGASGETVGLTVDEVREMITLTENEISGSEEEIPAAFREYVTGFCVREDNRIYLIDIYKISGKDPGKN